MLRTRILALIVMLTVLAGCYPADQPTPTPASAGGEQSAVAQAPTGEETSQDLTDITLAMGFIPSVQFAPLYVAQDRGYFEEAGINVEFQYGMESDLLKLVGTNQVQFMIGSGEEVILGRGQDLPVRYVFRWYRRFPVVLFAKASSGIQVPEDLAGKRVGISALHGASYVAWQALIHETSLDPSSVSLQTIGFTQASAISEDRVDAALDYVSNGPVQLRLAGEEVVVIPVSDYADLPSNGLITNDQTIREQPDIVEALVTATRRGLADTLTDPDAAFAISLEFVPEAGGEQTEVSRAIFDESLRLWQVNEGEALGVSDPKVWQDAAELMYESGLVSRLIPAEDLYTNQFVEEQ